MPHPTFSIWEQETFFPHQDVLIVGGGLMGLWTGLELRRKSSTLRVTVIERAPTPLGASTRNAGFACFGSPSELIRNAETMGTDAMLQVVEMRYKGIEKVKAHFSAEEIGFEACRGYECISRDYRYRAELGDKLDWLNTQLHPITGIMQTFRRVDEKISSLGLRNFDALVENPTESALDSGKLVASLMQRAREAGVQVLTGIELASWTEQQSGIRVETKQGIRFSADRLLFCTNGFSGSLLPQLPMEPARGQIIMTSPIPGLALKGAFHYDEGFYYWRNLGDRILLGGARNTAFDNERTTEMEGSAAIRQALEDFLVKHFDNQHKYTIDHHWSGIMAFTANRLPLVEKIADGVFAAIACNGMGVALTPIVAEQAAAAVA